MGNANSGRRSNYVEVKRGNLLKVTTDWLIDNFHKFDDETKLKVALVIAPKGITDKVEHSGLTETRIVIFTPPERLVEGRVQSLTV